jgi:hypothetical protein
VIFASPAWLAALLVLPCSRPRGVLPPGQDRPGSSRPLWGVWFSARPSAGGGSCPVLARARRALARPQWGILREKVEREGVDVVLVLDTSGSMATADVAPSRFFLARQALLQLIARLEGDRFALVAFEGEAYPLVPLTLDADALGLFLETVEPGSSPRPARRSASASRKACRPSSTRSGGTRSWCSSPTARTSRGRSRRR